jgi:CDP-glycerol glycerophosphotransferase (TagB/SpsB family)
MRWIERVAAGIAGIALRQVDRFVPKVANAWVFGALSGERFVDNSKYLFLHALAHAAPGTQLTWVTRRARVLRTLRQHGIPCVHNYSPRGIWTVLRASHRVISTRRNDVMYFYPRPDRPTFHLHHGMPVKRIGKHYHRWDAARASILDRLWTRYVVGCEWHQMAAVLSTSTFYDRTLRDALGIAHGFITGQPRTDVLLSQPRSARGLVPTEAEVRRRLGLHAPFIATYLPTHRNFGVGRQPAILFAEDLDARRKLRAAGIQIAVKLHPEAMRRSSLPDDTVVDVSSRCEDPQDLLRVTHCLVTDYSSVFVDYLLLDRPIVFYLYDETDYITNDNEVYFRLADRPVGLITRDERAVLDAILEARAGGDPQRAERRKHISFFHEHVDDRACERAWTELTRFARSRRSA